MIDFKSVAGNGVIESEKNSQAYGERQKALKAFAAALGLNESDVVTVTGKTTSFDFSKVTKEAAAKAGYDYDKLKELVDASKAEGENRFSSLDLITKYNSGMKETDHAALLKAVATAPAYPADSLQADILTKLLANDKTKALGEKIKADPEKTPVSAADAALIRDLLGDRKDALYKDAFAPAESYKNLSALTKAVDEVDTTLDLVAAYSNPSKEAKANFEKLARSGEYSNEVLEEISRNSAWFEPQDLERALKVLSPNGKIEAYKGIKIPEGEGWSLTKLTKEMAAADGTYTLNTNAGKLNEGSRAVFSKLMKNDEFRKENPELMESLSKNGQIQNEAELKLVLKGLKEDRKDIKYPDDGSIMTLGQLNRLLSVKKPDEKSDKPHYRNVAQVKALLKKDGKTSDGFGFLRHSEDLNDEIFKSKTENGVTTYKHFIYKDGAWVIDTKKLASLIQDNIWKDKNGAKVYKDSSEDYHFYRTASNPTGKAFTDGQTAGVYSEKNLIDHWNFTFPNDPIKIEEKPKAETASARTREGGEESGNTENTQRQNREARGGGTGRGGRVSATAEADASAEASASAGKR